MTRQSLGTTARELAAGAEFLVRAAAAQFYAIVKRPSGSFEPIRF